MIYKSVTSRWILERVWSSIDKRKSRKTVGGKSMFVVVDMVVVVVGIGAVAVVVVVVVVASTFLRGWGEEVGRRR